MDTKIVRYILCRMLGVEAALLLVPVLVAVIYQEKCGIVFLIPIVILCLLFWVVGRKRPRITIQLSCSAISDWNAYFSAIF